MSSGDSLDVQYKKLGKSEFMGTPGHTKWANSPQDNFTREFDLGTAERAVEPLNVKPYTPGDYIELWGYSDEPVEKRIISSYISFIRKEVLNLIYKNKIKSAEKKANELVSFAQKCGLDTIKMDADLKWYLSNPRYVKHNYDYL